jgi:hypothetical protein
MNTSAMSFNVIGASRTARQGVSHPHRKPPPFDNERANARHSTSRLLGRNYRCVQKMPSLQQEERGGRPSPKESHQHTAIQVLGIKDGLSARSALQSQYVLYIWSVTPVAQESPRGPRAEAQLLLPVITCGTWCGYYLGVARRSELTGCTARLGPTPAPWPPPYYGRECTD